MDVAYGTGNISILSNTGGSRLKLTSSNNPSQVGEKVIFTSGVRPTFHVGIPSGTVSFFDGSDLLGTAALAGGKAMLTVSTLSAGQHLIQAHYNGDTNNGTASDVYTIGVTLTDDDTGSATGSTQTTVSNVAPSNTSEQGCSS